MPPSFSGVKFLSIPFKGVFVSWILKLSQRIWYLNPAQFSPVNLGFINLEDLTIEKKAKNKFGVVPCIQTALTVLFYTGYREECHYSADPPFANQSF